MNREEQGILKGTPIGWVQNITYGDANRYLERWGSPLNLLSTRPFEENFRNLEEAFGRVSGVEAKIYYAHKANKCREFVKAALLLHGGIDVASESEWNTARECGAKPNQIVVTAQIKSVSFLREIIRCGSCIVVDSREEFEEIEIEAREIGKKAKVALRLSGFSLDDGVVQSRFGIPISSAWNLVQEIHERYSHFSLRGLHFHLPGYGARDRALALSATLDMAERCRSSGYLLKFIDIGGGFPVSYLESKVQWKDHWGSEEPPKVEDGLAIRSYPYWNDGDIGSYVCEIGSYRSDAGGVSNAERLRALNLELRSEPGRFLLQKCGVTLARVGKVKESSLQHDVVVCDINGTQLRPSKGDFLVDPLLLRRGNRCSPSRAVSGRGQQYFVCGRYCSENDRLYQRPIAFPCKPEKGDILLFPNTAGYHMHFLETEGHGFDLAQNRFIEGTVDMGKCPT